jgi:hypothetical protein
LEATRGFELVDGDHDCALHREATLSVIFQGLPEKIYELIEKPSYMELVKGIEGVTGIVMVILMAVAFILATRWFKWSLIKLPSPLVGSLVSMPSRTHTTYLSLSMPCSLFMARTFLYLAHKWNLQWHIYRLEVPLVRQIEKCAIDNVQALQKICQIATCILTRVRHCTRVKMFATSILTRVLRVSDVKDSNCTF